MSDRDNDQSFYNYNWNKFIKRVKEGHRSHRLSPLPRPLTLLVNNGVIHHAVIIDIEEKSMLAWSDDLMMWQEEVELEIFYHSPDPQIGRSDRGLCSQQNFTG